MSLGVAIKGPEGVVLAADSRVTLAASVVANPQQPPLLVNFENATKLLHFSGDTHVFVGAVTYGNALIALRTAHSLVPEFELTLPPNRLPVADYATRLRDFFSERWNAVQPQVQEPMFFLVGGYDEGAAYGRVYGFQVPAAGTDIEEKNPGEGHFGMSWGGQVQVASRIIHGFDPEVIPALAQRLNLPAQDVFQHFQALGPALQLRVPYDVLALQDCIDLATFLIRTTVSAQNLSVTVRGVGGAVDVAYMTRTAGLKFVQRKTIRGEAGSTND